MPAAFPWQRPEPAQGPEQPEAGPEKKRMVNCRQELPRARVPELGPQRQQARRQPERQAEPVVGGQAQQARPPPGLPEPEPGQEQVLLVREGLRRPVARPAGAARFPAAQYWPERQAAPESRWLR